MTEMGTRVRINFEQLGELTEGYESPGSFEQFSAIELSARKYLLGRFYQLAHQAPATQAAHLEHNWQALLDLESTDLDSTNQLLLAPATGSWLSIVNAHLEHDQSVATMAQHIGYLGNVVAGHALRRPDPSCDVWGAAQNGRLHIAGMGTATLPEDVEFARITTEVQGFSIYTDDTRIAVVDPDVASEFWRPVPRYTSSTFWFENQPHQLDILLEDSDPYHSAVSPHQLTEDEHTIWQERLDGAWQILQSIHPAGARELARGLSCIVPKPPRARFEAYSSSSNVSIGSIEASLPANSTEAAEILLHEYSGHGKLNKVLLATGKSVGPDTLGAALYAPWRDDPRPSGGLLHGIYSFSQVVDYYDRLRASVEAGSPEADLADFERLLWHRQTRSTIEMLNDLWFDQNSWRKVYDSYGVIPPVIRHHLDGEAMPVNSLRVRDIKLLATNPLAEKESALRMTGAFVILRGMAASYKSYSHGTPNNTEQLVELARLDHRALWRAHHLAPDQEALDKLISASHGGASKLPITFGVPSEVQVDPTACRLDERAVLIRHYLSDREAFIDQAVDEPDKLKRADMALIIGNTLLARETYLEILEQEPLNKRAFVGALLADKLPHVTQRPDLRMPHILLAIQRCLLEKDQPPADIPTLREYLWPIMSPMTPPGV